MVASLMFFRSDDDDSESAHTASWSRFSGAAAVLVNVAQPLGEISVDDEAEDKAAKKCPLESGSGSCKPESPVFVASNWRLSHCFCAGEPL